MAQSQARDEAGNIWNIDEAGNPVSLAQAAGQQQADPNVIAPNPVQARLQALQAANAEISGQRTTQQMQMDAATADAVKTKADADARKAVTDATKAERELAVVPKANQEVSDRLSRLKQLASQINRTQSLYNTGIGTTKGIAGIKDYLPTDANARFDVAGAGLSQQGLAAFRVPGTGTVSDRDAMMFDRANLPTASTRDVAVDEQLRGIRARVDEEMRALGQKPVNWQTSIDGGTAQPQQTQPAMMVPGAGTTPPQTPQGPAGYDVGSVAGAPSGGMGGGGNFASAAGVAMAKRLSQAYTKGAGVQELNRLLSDNGFQTFSDPGTIAAIQKRGRLNFAPPVADDTRGTVGRALGGLADSAGGAYAISAADALTAGTLDNIAGGQSGLAMEYARQQYPGASLAGTVTGGALGAAGAEMGLARAGLGAGAAALGGDALYGAAYGAGSTENGSRLLGAAGGGLGGLAGSYAGRGIARGVGSAFRGVQDANVQGLRAAGVPLTAGQALGGTAKGIEDRLSGLPVVGDMVNARRLEGMQGFNRAAFDEALAPISANTGGVTGEAGIDAALAARSEGYKRALDGVSVQEDPAFTAQFQAAQQAASRLPSEMADNARYTLGKVDEGFQSNSPIQKTGSGHGWQDYTYTSQNGDNIPFTTYPTRRGHGPIEISIDEQNLGGANRLGVGELRQAATQLRREFPEATQLHGLRISGAGAGRTQSFDFSKIVPADALPRTLDGNGLQQSIRTLRRDASSVSAQPYGYDFGQVTGQAENALTGLIERQSPATMPALNAANAANRRVEVLRDAVNRARNGTRVGETGTFAPSQLADAAAANAKKFGNSQGTTRQPFFNLSRAGQAVLPNSVPDSGTAGRAIVGGLLTGAGLGGGTGYAAGDAGTGAGYGLGAAALLAAGGSRAGQRALTAALLDRPEFAIRAGNGIANRARIGGLFGAPMLAGAGASLATQ